MTCFVLSTKGSRATDTAGTGSQGRADGRTIGASVGVAARIAQRQAGIPAAALPATVGRQQRRRSQLCAVSGSGGGGGGSSSSSSAGDRGRRDGGTRVRVVFAVSVGGGGGGFGGGFGGRPGGGGQRRRRQRMIAGVGAQGRRGQVVQEVEVGHGLAFLVAEPDEEVAAAHDGLPERWSAAPEHAETVPDRRR